MTDANDRDSDGPQERRETFQSRGGSHAVGATDDSSVSSQPERVPAAESAGADRTDTDEAPGGAGRDGAHEVPEPVVIEHQVAPTASVEAEPIPAPRAEAESLPANPASAAEQRQTYVEVLQPPAKKSNRGFGALIAFLATIVFALVWAAVAATIIAIGSTPNAFGESVTNFLTSAAFWTPVGGFFIFFLLTAVALNRAGWGWYILIGFLIGVLVYGTYLLGALLTVSRQITPSEVNPFLSSIAITALAIGAGLVAREISIWAGAAISARGRRITARNAQAQADYETETAERRAEYERAIAGRSA